MAKRWLKIGMIGLVAVGIMAVALALVADTASAQGPGGRGNRGGGNGNGGYGQQGQYQNQVDPGTNCLTGDCIPLGSGLGTMSGYGAMNGNGAQNQSMYQSQINGILANLPPAVAGPVPADVIAALEAGLQDEWNAYNTYQLVIDQFGAVRPFTSIQNAEAQHSASLGYLFERYGLTLPTMEPVAPVTFTSLQDACSTGLAAEIANAGLYDQWLATVSNYPDMVQVFTALRDASLYQHLPAFERCAG